MKKLVLVACLLVSGIAQAGVVSGGGGMAVVCRDSVGKIQEAKLLDLYEAQQKQIPLKSLPDEVSYYRLFMTRWVESHGAKAKPESDDVIREYISDVLAPPITMFTVAGEKLRPTKDYSGPMKFGDCNVEQFAVFYDGHERFGVKLFIDSEIWNATDAQSRMALLAHEFVYRNDRLTKGVSDSAKARLTVGHLFSDY